MTLPELKARVQAPPGPVLDVHVHVGSGFGPDTAADPERDTERLLAAADRAGITHLVVNCLGPRCPPNPGPDDLRSANDVTLRAVDAYPERVMGFCYVSGEHLKESLAEVERCVASRRLVGLKMWIACKASDPRVVELAAAAAQLGVPILQHAWSKVTGNLPGESTPDDVAKLARAVPDARIIMAHLYGHGLRGVERIEACTNIAVDISGGDPESGVLPYAVARLGHRRVVFGSDAPIRHFGVTLGKVLDAGLSIEQQRAILFDNAVRLLPSWAPVQALEAVR